MEHHEGQIQHIERLIDTLIEDMHKEASPAFQEILERIPVRVEWDSPEHNKYGDFFGVPLDIGDGSDAAPADILLYAEPLWRYAQGDEQRLHDQVKKTLMHEIGHYLGLDHKELGERGLT